MINTFSKFYYGYVITSTTKYLDFNEGSGQLTAILRVGHYTLQTLCDEISFQMNDVGAYGYTVTPNRTTRIITISASGTFKVLASTGTNVVNGCYSAIGLSASDGSYATSRVGTTAIGTVYTPQYKLQDYVSSSDSQMLRDATIIKSASGVSEVISFGTDMFFEFNIKFATDIYQPSSGPITNNNAGVANLRSLMQYLMNQYEVELMPNKDDPTVAYRLVLDGMKEYKLKEQYANGLVGYFETGVLKFRVVEE